MNILLISKNYPPKICGVGDHSHHLKQAWEKMGHTVWIFNTGNKSEEVGVVSCLENELSRAITRQLHDIITSQKIDLLFWQYVPYSYQQKGLPAWLPSVMRQLQKTGVQQRVYFHEVSLRLSGDGWKQSVLAFAQQRIAHKMAALTNQSFTSIQLYRTYFKKNPPIVVPVGSNLPLPEAPARTSPNRMVCFANRADRALIAAVLELRKAIPAHLTLCGSVDQQQRAYLESWVKKYDAGDWLKITGEMTPDALAQCIASAAVFIQPQVTDQRGRGGISAKNGTIMAAMSLGKPIITCAGDMTDDRLFKNGENMLFVPYGDATAYWEALLRLLQDKMLAQTLGANAAATYQQHCSWERIATQLLPVSHQNELQSLPQP